MAVPFGMELVLQERLLGTGLLLDAETKVRLDFLEITRTTQGASSGTAP
jgi:hypothetical protein